MTLQQRAMAVVREMVVAGNLLSLRDNEVPCVDCGARATEYDHRNYAEPHAVEPVCRKCNIRRGPTVDWRQRHLSVKRFNKNPINETLLKGRMVNFRLTDAQAARVWSAAAAARRSVSDFVRHAVITAANRKQKG